MKKTLILISFILLTITICSSNKLIEIPSEAIRYRIIPNSNSVFDQNIKEIFNKEIINILENLPKSKDIDKERAILKESIPIISSKIDEIKTEIEYDKDIKINYGQNYFPKKEYKGFLYKEGYYESLVIEIGEAKGNNFWCVLFPPLCMIDENNEEVEYTFAIKEILNKYKKTNK